MPVELGASQAKTTAAEKMVHELQVQLNGLRMDDETRLQKENEVRTLSS